MQSQPARILLHLQTTQQSLRLEAGSPRQMALWLSINVAMITPSQTPVIQIHLSHATAAPGQAQLQHVLSLVSSLLEGLSLASSPLALLAQVGRIQKKEAY